MSTWVIRSRPDQGPSVVASTPGFTVAPSISPTSGIEGATFTAGNGTAINATSYARRWLLSGTSIGTGATVAPQDPGSLVLEVTATGPGGTTKAYSNAVVVAAVPAPTPTPTPEPTLPGSIGNLTVPSLTQTTAQLAFTNASGAITHQYRLDGGSAQSLAGNKIVTGLTADTEYDFQVRGVNAAGNGSWSNVVTDTTDAEEGPSDPAALTAPTLTRVSGPEEYGTDLVITFNRPNEWIDDDQAVMQRSTDYTFGTGVSEVVHTMLAAVTTYDFDVQSVVSGSWFFRMGAWRGTRPADEDQNWSNIVNVGDVIDPTITTNASQSSMVVPLTANEGVTWEIVGGAQAGAWEIVGTNLVPVGGSVAVSVNEIIVRATDYAENATDKTITITLDVTPAAFTFTDVSGATVATQYTSNTITVSGLGSGVAVPVSITGGTYSKNGGAYTSSTGTAINGDTFAVRTTSGGSASTVNVVLTIGTVSDTYSVATAGMAWVQANGVNKDPSITIAGLPPLIATRGGDLNWRGVRANQDPVANAYQYEFILLSQDAGAELLIGTMNESWDMQVHTDFPWAESPNGLQFNIGTGTAPIPPYPFPFTIHSAGSGYSSDISGTYGTPVFGGAHPDVITFRGNQSAGSAEIWLNRWNGSAYTSTLLLSRGPGTISDHRPTAMLLAGNSVRLNAGDLAFAKPLADGYSAANG